MKFTRCLFGFIVFVAFCLFLRADVRDNYHQPEKVMDTVSVEPVDMVFIVNAFHDLAKPVELLNNIVPSLKPGAVVVIIDRDPAKVRGYNRHVLTQEEVLEHIKNSDFDLDRIEAFLFQHNIYIIEVGEKGKD